MDWATVAASVCLGAVTGGAVNWIYRLVGERHLDAYRSGLREDADKAIADHRSAIDVALVEKKAAIDVQLAGVNAAVRQQVDEAIAARRAGYERELESHKAALKQASDAALADQQGTIRRVVERELRSHESTLKLEVEVQLRLFDADAATLNAMREMAIDLVSSVRAAEYAWAMRRQGGFDATLERVESLSAKSARITSSIYLLAADRRAALVPLVNAAALYVSHLVSLVATINQGEPPPAKLASSRETSTNVYLAFDQAGEDLTKWIAEVAHRRREEIERLLSASSRESRPSIDVRSHDADS